MILFNKYFFYKNDETMVFVRFSANIARYLTILLTLAK